MEVTKQKVLVVEDEVNLRDVLRIQLESEGFHSTDFNFCPLIFAF